MAVAVIIGPAFEQAGEGDIVPQFTFFPVYKLIQTERVDVKRTRTRGWWRRRGAARRAFQRRVRA